MALRPIWALEPTKGVSEMATLADISASAKKQKTSKNHTVMYVAGILSDCQELLGPDLNDENGWVSPDNAKQVIDLLNKAKRIMFSGAGTFGLDGIEPEFDAPILFKTTS